MMKSNRRLNGSPSHPAQRGATLIIALLILLAMTILGTSSMNTLTLEERMINNLRDENVSFQAAESGLAACETNIREQDPALSGNKYYKQGEVSALAASSAAFWWDDDTVWGDASLPMPDSVDTDAANLGRGGVSAEPICIREHIGLAPDDLSFETRAKRIGAEMYTVTVKGYGAENSTESTVQSVLFARYK